MDKKVNVLLTNDDGINGEGLIRLKEALEKLKHINIITIAPDQERSASSHRITIFEPLILKEVQKNTYTLNGTPADCVKVALEGFLKEKIDIIVSGTNNGPNMGADVFYSGTVAAAREGAIHNIPAIAFSIDGYGHEKYFDTSSHYAVELFNHILKQDLPNNLLLNINFPNIPISDVKGNKVTILGNRVYHDQVIERTAPFGWKYFWFGGDLPGYTPKENSDFEAVNNNYISITPLQLDQTDYTFIEELEKWKF